MSSLVERCCAADPASRPTFAEVLEELSGPVADECTRGFGSDAAWALLRHEVTVAGAEGMAFGSDAALAGAEEPATAGAGGGFSLLPPPPAPRPADVEMVGVEDLKRKQRLRASEVFKGTANPLNGDAAQRRRTGTVTKPNDLCDI